MRARIGRLAILTLTFVLGFAAGPAHAEVEWRMAHKMPPDSSTKRFRTSR